MRPLILPADTIISVVQIDHFHLVEGSLFIPGSWLASPWSLCEPGSSMRMTCFLSCVQRKERAPKYLRLSRIVDFWPWQGPTGKDVALLLWEQGAGCGPCGKHCSYQLCLLPACDLGNNQDHGFLPGAGLLGRPPHPPAAAFPAATCGAVRLLSSSPGVSGIPPAAGVAGCVKPWLRAGHQAPL